MTPLAVIAARLAQYGAAMILFGSPLFFVYGLSAEAPNAAPKAGWTRGMLIAAAVVMLVAAIAALCAQTATMTDSPADAFVPASLMMVLTGTQFGMALGARFTLTAAALGLLLVVKRSRSLWLAVAVLGGGVVASFAWTGHGASDDGWPGLIHLAADILHLLASAIWLGALAGLTAVIFGARPAQSPASLTILRHALESFSGVGSAAVALLLATGLLNSLFLVGLGHVGDLWRTTYGLLLLGKVGLFGLMVILAAVNRFRLTPQLKAALEPSPLRYHKVRALPDRQTEPTLAESALAGGVSPEIAVAQLRRSVGLETAIGLGVLMLVSVLGTLAPLNS